MSSNVLSLLSWPLVWVAALSLAAFLTLYWALRGAPPGQAVADQEDDEAPAAAYRDRVIAAVVVGLLLVGAGAYVALSGNLAWSIPLFACGFAIVLRLIVVNQRYRHASPALQRTIGFSNAALNASLLAGVLIVLNVVTFRYGGQPLDFTRERAFSLSSLTLNQLATLKRQVTLTMLYGEGPRAVPLAERVRQLLELYKAAQPEKVEIQSLDPFRNPERFEELAKRAPDVAVIQGGGVLIEYGEGESASRVVVRNNDLFELPAQGGREGSAVRFETEFRGEDAITSALIGLREEKKPKIVFTVGHGESSINEVDPRKSGLGVWKSRLTSDGSEVLEINLIKDEIPADASAVVVAAPKSPFKSDETAKLKTYSDKGGPLLLQPAQEGQLALGQARVEHTRRKAQAAHQTRGVERTQGRIGFAGRPLLGIESVVVGRGDQHGVGHGPTRDRRAHLGFQDVEQRLIAVQHAVFPFLGVMQLGHVAAELRAAPRHQGPQLRVLALLQAAHGQAGQRIQGRADRPGQCPLRQPRCEAAVSYTHLTLPTILRV